MTGQADLEKLMIRYQAGDFSAAEALIEHLSSQLRRLFVAKTCNRADADDLLQETWLRIHRVRHTYRTGEPVLPWLYAIAQRVAVDHYRRSRRVAARAVSLQEFGEAAIPEVAEKDDGLDELLAPLTRAQREILVMLKVTGMSLDEVARATSSSVGSVKQKVHRAYRKLRHKLNRENARRRPGGESA
jgi:RNA polymerase sigma-70 factor (ECF subfamily)